MTLPAGSRLGPYEIIGAIGTGGMGEVYRARDTRLHRDVAVKVLPEAVAADPDRLTRFEREARVLASLNHPHIAQIHGLEQSGTTLALVMELVEGEDLAAAIARGPIAVREAIAIARQIAAALEAAHGKGIVHRDLKPANIRLTGSRAVKVLDFGLAKSLESGDEPGAAAGSAPTVTSLATRLGVVMGTAAYMAPEQARGIPVDKRADIWAFGCVVFEMLAARAPFPGATSTEVVAAILERDPDWTALPAHTPAALRRLLRRCLHKDPDHRLHDIADARIELEEIAAAPPETDAASPPAHASGPRVAMTAGIALVASLAAGALGWFLRPASSASEIRLEITTPPTNDASLAVSPDGRKLVFVARNGNQSQLWLRSFDSSSARPLPGTERASRPFWSPDSRSIGFFADTRLKRMDIDGGSVKTLTLQSAVPIGGTWNRDGVILFADNPGGPILRVSADGGEQTPVTQVQAPQQRGHHAPKFLPDGRHFLFFVTGTPEGRGVYLGELGKPDTKRLFDADTAASFEASGHLLFIRNNKLYAQRFDPDRGELSGEASIVDDDRVNAGTSLATSGTGQIAYRTRAPVQHQFVWFDRSGRQVDKVLYPDTAGMGPALSHNGRRIALFRWVDGNMDIWTYDISRKTWERATFAAGDDIYPLWSHDDSSLIFGGLRDNTRMRMFRKRLDAPPNAEEILLPQSAHGESVGQWPLDLSPDGRFLLYANLMPKRAPDIWALPLAGDRKPFEVVVTDFNESQAEFSPDGKWIAYQSDKSGREEIYLRPFPGPGQEWSVSTGGGIQPRWNPKGTELFYVAPDDKLMTVPVRFSADNKTADLGAPAGLFTTDVGSTVQLKYRQQYMVSRDGQSFVLNSAVEGGGTSPITVILNWKPSR